MVSIINDLQVLSIEPGIFEVLVSMYTGMLSLAIINRFFLVKPEYFEKKNIAPGGNRTHAVSLSRCLDECSII